MRVFRTSGLASRLRTRNVMMPVTAERVPRSPVVSIAPPVVPRPTVIVGMGPVGISTAQELLKRDPEHPVVLYGNEPWQPYDRVKLSALLAGEITYAALINQLTVPESHRVIQRHACEVLSIDRNACTVTDATGQVQAYAHLVLAVGSRPKIPAIPGIDRAGVYTFRNMNNAQALLARRVRSRHTVVLGGGLLGLEAARAMQRDRTQVTVIEHNSRLMWQQLDDDAGEMLRRHVVSLGMSVVLADGVREILGDERVAAVRLASGRTVACDTLILAVGILPNVDLAAAHGLSVGRGIRVNDRMQTSDPRIYAAGECAEHRGRTYGLVAPGLEQSAVVAHCILGGTSRYTGSIAATRLKVIDRPLFSIGAVNDLDVTPSQRCVTYVHPDGGLYRKLVLDRGRAIGAIVLGDEDEVARLQEFVKLKRRLWPWQERRFRRGGRIWPSGSGRSVAQWPTRMVVCTCTGVTRGVLSAAVARGCTTVDTLSGATRAATVCGSCRPLLIELLGGAAGVVPAAAYRTLVVVAALVLAALAGIVGPAVVPYSATTRLTWAWDQLWRDGVLRQATGFTLLGLSVFLGFLSVPKRVARSTPERYGWWRTGHVVVGGIAVIALIAHTGLRMGAHLDWWLMATFLLMLAAGATASLSMGLEHRLPTATARRLRAQAVWLHLLLLWPVPVLLAFHVLKAYYF
ncbi:MAG: FAD-dependent oxidoreductase [Nitrospirota bacterium]